MNTSEGKERKGQSTVGQTDDLRPGNSGAAFMSTHGLINLCNSAKTFCSLLKFIFGFGYLTR